MNNCTCNHRQDDEKTQELKGIIAKLLEAKELYGDVATLSDTTIGDAIDVAIAVAKASIVINKLDSDISDMDEWRGEYE